MAKQQSLSRWTTKEEKLLRTIVKAAKKSSEGFAEASRQLGRSIGSVSFKYYTLDDPKKYDSRRPTSSHKSTNTSKVNVNITFKIDDTWLPSKVSNAKDNATLKAIEQTASSLRPGQSFPIPVTTITSQIGWKDSTASTCIRVFLKNTMNIDMYNRIKIHEVRDMDRKLVSIRVRRAVEA